MSRRGLSRERVISVAGDLADAEGLAAVTVARVAAELGVRGPSIYNHVEGLAALRRGVAIAALDQLRDKLAAAAVGRSGEDALLGAAHAYREYASSHPGRYDAMQRAPAAGDAEQEAAAAELVAVLADILRGWELDEADTIHAIRAIRSALHGFVDLERVGGFGLDLPLSDSYERLVLGLAAGLGRRAG